MVGFMNSFLYYLFRFYSLVNMDDCWQVSRDAQGIIQADPQAFPSGIPALVDYVHSKKLKFGLYSGMGSRRSAPAHKFRWKNF